MEPCKAQGDSATPAEQLAQRVRSARLPSPDERARIRREARLPLRDFAEALGVTTATVYRWETGGVEPKAAHAVAYADLLNKIQQALASGAKGETS